MRFRCRHCGQETTDPLAHATEHRLPQTMAQVWEGFTLLGGKRDPVRRAPDWACEGQQEMW